MMQRITKTSKANLMAADAAEIVGNCIDRDAQPRVMLRVKRGDSSAFLWGADDFLMWKSPTEARRFVKRFRSDLEPTSFDPQ